MARDTESARTWCAENDARLLTIIDRSAIAGIVDTLSNCEGAFCWRQSIPIIIIIK